MTASEQMLALVEGSKNLRRLCREYETESVTVHLKELVGGAFSLYAAATIRRTGGVHVFVAEDRDAAAYLLNDLYALLDESAVYRPKAAPASRSRMNVTFTTPSPELDAKFVKEAAAAGFVNLKGHRTVGGMRASIYNAMPIEGVEKLVAFMKAFEEANA